MARLEVTIAKGATRDSILVRRGVVEIASFAFPKKGPIPHDYVHLIVEAAFGLGDGFWGMVSRGIPPQDIQEIAKAGGHASASRAVAPAPEIVELIQAERLVECFEADLWSGGADHETFRSIAAAACTQSFVPCPALADDTINSVRANIAAFARAWIAAPVGARFAFNWPIRSI
jgi:hypothetical protein